MKFLRAIATIIVFLFVTFLMIALFIPDLMEQDKETADLTRVSSHYYEAVRMSRASFAREDTQNVQGEIRRLPETAVDWIQLFDPNNTAKAPGGGPAYLPNDVDGDAETGAIGIVFSAEGNVVIAKPAFRELQAHSTTVKPQSDPVKK